MKFIKLTKPTDKTVIINVESIGSISEQDNPYAKGDHTLLVLNSKREHIVKESLTTVEDLLANTN